MTQFDECIGVDLDKNASNTALPNDLHSASANFIVLTTWLWDETDPFGANK